MGFLSKAVCVAGLLAATAAGNEFFEAALAVDEECSIGDSTCAFNAIQMRSLAQQAESNDEGKPKSKAQDLSAAWEQKIYAWIVYIHKNLTLLDWKMFYLKMDMNSTNNTLFGIDGVKGVNGTDVNWMKHPATWIPNFGNDTDAGAPDADSDEEVTTTSEDTTTKAPAAAKAKANAKAKAKAKATTTAAPAEDAEADEQDASLLESQEAVGEADDSASRRRKDSLKGVPPRTKKMQALMTAEQTRLNGMWDSITMAKRQLNWLGNYMGSHRRLFHGRAVLVTKAEAMSHERIIERSRYAGHPAGWEASDASPAPEANLIEQITSALNQTQDLWMQLYQLGGMVQATKQRVKRYMKGKPGNLLQEQAGEIAWSHGGYHGFDSLHEDSAQNKGDDDDADDGDDDDGEEDDASQPAGAASTTQAADADDDAADDA